MGNQTQQSIRFPSSRSKNSHERKLAGIAGNLKHDYKNGNLSQEYIDLCESIPGWTWTAHEFCTKEEFVQWCKDNDIKTEPQFRKWKKKNKRPKNITAIPERIYDDFHWGELSGKKWKNDWCTKEEFVQWCKNNGIKDSTDFLNWKKKNTKPDNIPDKPYIYDNWSWGIITGRFKDGNWMSMEKFIQWCKDNGIKRKKDFTSLRKRPRGVPAAPYSIYKDFSWKMI